MDKIDFSKAGLGRRNYVAILADLGEGLCCGHCLSIVILHLDLAQKLSM